MIVIEEQSNNIDNANAREADKEGHL